MQEYAIVKEINKTLEFQVDTTQLNIKHENDILILLNT